MPAPRQPSAEHKAGLTVELNGRTRSRTGPLAGRLRMGGDREHHPVRLTSQTRWIAASASGATSRVQLSRSSSAASYSIDGSIAAVPRIGNTSPSQTRALCQMFAGQDGLPDRPPCARQSHAAHPASRWQRHLGLLKSWGPRSVRPGKHPRCGKAPSARHRCCSALCALRDRRQESPSLPVANEHAILADCFGARARADLTAWASTECQRCARRNPRVCCWSCRGHV